MTTNKKEGWRERFDERFERTIYSIDDIKDFIENELSRVIKILEGMKERMATVEDGDNEIFIAQHNAYSTALNDIIKALEEEEI